MTKSPPLTIDDLIPWQLITPAQKLELMRGMILNNPSLEIQELLLNESNKDIQFALARHTRYPEVFKKLYEKDVKIPLSNQYIPTDVLDEIYDKEGHMFVIQDALAIHPNTSVRVLEELSHITHPNTVGKIARLRLSIRKYVEMNPNQSELSFLLTSKYINFIEDQE